MAQGTHVFWTSNSPSLSVTYQPSGISALPHHCNSCNPPVYRPAALPLCCCRVLYAKCSRVTWCVSRCPWSQSWRELWPRSTAAAAHTRLWSKGTLPEGMPSNNRLPLQVPPTLANAPPSQAPEHRHTSTLVHWTAHTDLGTGRENINWWPLFASHLANAGTVSVLYFLLHQFLIQYHHYSNWPSPQQDLELCAVVWGWPITLVMGKDHKSPTEHYLLSTRSIPPLPSNERGAPETAHNSPYCINRLIAGGLLTTTYIVTSNT